ncbi:hypothetical protein [Mesorhizobium sp. 1B3]|uniref:hypothetical protein n=1 Tax=Mesorhizobium sp. 1B3 TaxID=3243599 RepID=UPI003D96EE88
MRLLQASATVEAFCLTLEIGDCASAAIAQKSLFLPRLLSRRLTVGGQVHEF